MNAELLSYSKECCIIVILFLCSYLQGKKVEKYIICPVVLYDLIVCKMQHHKNHFVLKSANKYS